MKTLKWLDDNLEEVILFVLLCVMTLVMGVQIVARYVFNNSFSWTEELTRYLFIISGFLSISYCIKKQLSISISQFVEALPSVVQMIVEFSGDVIQLIFYGYLIPYAYQYWRGAIESGQKSTGLGLPMYVMQIVPMICFLLAVLRLLEQIYMKMREYRNDKTMEKGGM